MMRSMRFVVRLSSFLTIILFIVCVAWANNELKDKSQPATANDVIGVWEMFYQKHKTLPSINSLFFAPYQRFHFLNDGYVKNLTSQKPFEPSILAVWGKAPKSARYAFAKPGVMIITRTGNDRDIIIVSIITGDIKQKLLQDAPLLKKGDLIMAYLTPDKQLYMQRYLRRVH